MDSAQRGWCRYTQLENIIHDEKLPREASEAQQRSVRRHVLVLAPISFLLFLGFIAWLYGYTGCNCQTMPIKEVLRKFYVFLNCYGLYAYIAMALIDRMQHILCLASIGTSKYRPSTINSTVYRAIT